MLLSKWYAKLLFQICLTHLIGSGFCNFIISDTIFIPTHQITKKSRPLPQYPPFCLAPWNMTRSSSSYRRSLHKSFWIAREIVNRTNIGSGINLPFRGFFFLFNRWLIDLWLRYCTKLRLMMLLLMIVFVVILIGTVMPLKTL